MNRQTFEQLLTQGCKQVGFSPAESKVLLKGTIPYQAGLPEFDDGWRTGIELLVHDGHIVMPHPFIRVLDTVRGLDGSEHGWVFAVDGGNVHIQHLVKAGKLVMLKICSIPESTVANIVGSDRGESTKLSYGVWMLAPHPHKLNDEESAMLFPVRSKNPHLQLHNDALNAVAMLSKMMSFLFLTNHPAHHTVRVSPSSSRCAGRSVEWVAARSHYVVVDSGDNRRAGLGFAPKGVTQRAVHWRRTHWRTLSSERFKNKRGQRILIRRSWVGPTQWQDNNGQQYQVVL